MFLPLTARKVGGAVVTITGSNFTGVMAVTFNGIPVALNAISTLSSSITSTANSLPVSSVNGFPAGPDFAIIGTGTTAEAVYYQSISGTILLGVTRGYAGTTARSWVVGTTVSPTYMLLDSVTQITTISPPGSGMVDIMVTTPAGTSTTSSADEFTYVTPITQIGLISGTRSGRRYTDQRNCDTLSCHRNIPVV